MKYWRLLMTGVTEGLYIRRRQAVSALVMAFTVLLLVFGHRFGVPWWIALVVVVGIVRYLTWPIKRGGSPAEIVIIAAAVSPFVTSFAQTLGQRLAGQVKVKRFPRMTRRRRRHELQIRPPWGRAIIVELEPGIGDDALLALIDLNLNDPTWWGHRLRWDRTAAAWLPVPDDELQPPTDSALNR